MKIAQKRNNVVKESKLPNIKLLNEVCCSLSTFCPCKKSLDHYKQLLLVGFKGVE